MENERALDPHQGRRRNFRRSRFDGNLIQIELSQLHPSDQKACHDLYNALAEVETLVCDESEAAADLAARLSGLARTIGTAAYANPGTQQIVHRVAHDLRGGCLQMIVFSLDVSETLDESNRTLRFLAVDHMKIMRNAIIDLDGFGCQRDRAGGNHGVQFLYNRWSSANIRNESGPVQLYFSSSWNGDFAKTCFEFSSVQRIIYNLLSNSLHFTSNQSIKFSISAIPGTSPTDVRFSIENQIDVSQQLRLQKIFENEELLFSDGVTTDGTGLGLGICCDLVAAAYGLENRKTVIDGAYLELSTSGDQFRSAFYWPAL